MFRAHGYEISRLQNIRQRSDAEFQIRLDTGNLDEYLASA